MLPGVLGRMGMIVSREPMSLAGAGTGRARASDGVGEGEGESDAGETGRDISCGGGSVMLLVSLFGA